MPFEPRTSRPGLLAAALCWTVCSQGCGGGELGDTAVRPTKQRVLTLESTRYALPAALRDDDTLTVAHLAAVGTLVGGRAGVFELKEPAKGAAKAGATFKRIDSAAAVGLDTAKERIVIAQAKRLAVYDGQLDRSGLDEKLQGELTGLVAGAKDKTLWIATRSALFAFAGGELISFSKLGGAHELQASARGDRLVLRRAGGYQLLRQHGSRWQLQPRLRGGLRQLIPLGDDRLLAIEGKGLLVGSGATRWSRYVPAASGPLEGTVEKLALEPKSGAGWIITSSALSRVVGDTVYRCARPSGLGRLRMARVDTTGALWLSDGRALVRIAASSPVTYGDDVRPLVERNCSRCHGQQGPGRRLDSYQALRAEIDSAIEQVDSGKMPQDGALVGDRTLLRRWKSGGLRR